MNNDFFDNLKKVEVDISENIETEVKTSNRGKRRQIDDFVLNFEIDDDLDDELVSSMKNLINESNVLKSDLYKTYGRSEAYNMIYSLQKGVLSWKRAEKWCDFLGYRVLLDFAKIK